ncbi:MAG TPA: hypothetical protein VFR81_29430 [Longimicrobium sp.]|nr:hypothetical protein [Longimicrobium sp.]
MFRTALPAALALLLAAPAAGLAQAATPAAAPTLPAVKTLTMGGFGFEHTVTLPGTPTEVFDAVTGDLLPWWDHFFTPGRPARLYLEPRMGGCFCEEFDTLGNGARHAVVTFADRGKRLTFEGQLGLSGSGLHMVHTYEFAARADSTVLTVKVRGTGEMEPSWPAAVNGVWHHFIVERFKPYYERTRAQRR